MSSVNLHISMRTAIDLDVSEDYATHVKLLCLPTNDTSFIKHTNFVRGKKMTRVVRVTLT